MSDQYAILVKVLNDYKIKRKERRRLGSLIAHTHGLQDCHHHLYATVLLKVALLWLSSEYRGKGGRGQSTEKVLRCVMRREGPVFCL